MTKEFAEQLQTYIDIAGFTTQRAVALEADISHSTVSRLLDGSVSATPNVAVALMTAVQVPGEHREEFLLLAAGHDPEFLRDKLGINPRTEKDILTDLVRERARAEVESLVRQDNQSQAQPLATLIHKIQTPTSAR